MATCINTKTVKISKAHLNEGIDSIQVQVIAVLIQQQDVGLAEGDLGKGHSALLPSRQGVHGLQRQVTTNAKGPQMLPANWLFIVAAIWPQRTAICSVLFLVILVS